VLGDRQPAFDDLAQLKYTKRVIQEAMRLYPPAWMIPHFVENEALVGGHRIPARSPILLSPFVSQPRPDVLAQPAGIRSRTLHSRALRRAPALRVLPVWRRGGHQCIGNHFAMMECQLITAMMVQRLRPSLVAGHRVVPSSSMTLKPRYGMKMTLGAA